MRRDKIIEESLKTEVDKICTSSFADIKNKLPEVDKYINTKLDTEIDNVTKNKSFDTPKVKKVDKRIAIFLPLALASFIAIPVAIQFATMPVAPFKASVKVTAADLNSSLTFRANVDKNGNIIKESIMGIDRLGNIFASGLKKLNYLDNENTVNSFIDKSLKFIKEYDLLAEEFTTNFEVIRQEDSFVLDDIENENINYLFMGNKSDYKNVVDSIHLYDDIHNIYSLIDEDFTYENILKTFKNNEDLHEISAKYDNFNMYLNALENYSVIDDSFKSTLDEEDNDYISQTILKALEIENLDNDIFVTSLEKYDENYWFELGNFN